MLIRKGILKDSVLTWNGVEYDVSKNYILCEAYQGICYKAIEAGFSEPVMLAVYEIGPDELDVLTVDYMKFKKDRSADASRYYQEKTGKTETDVFAMKTEAAERMFDSLGLLTRAGEKEYEAAVLADAGFVPKDKTVKKEPKKAEPPKKGAKKAKVKGRANSGFSKYSVKQLGYMGYKEITADELDCLHQIPFDDAELIMEKVLEGDKLRWFLHPNDPAIMPAMKYRKEKVCEPFGSSSH